jgi:two-component system chemotaxis response regulator CheB
VSKIRVLVTDDSVVIRKLVSGVLNSDPAIEVVGTAVNGRASLQKIEQLRPDIVTMDVEMPEVDGIEGVRRIRAAGHKLPIIMFSTLTERGASATLDALAAGASDYVAKPANVGSVGRSIEQVRDSLIPRIKALVPARGLAAAPQPGASSRPVGTGGPATLRPHAPVPAGGHKLLVIGSSTGGPDAVQRLLTALPPLPVPVALVQHMPPLFTSQFAQRLDRQTRFDVVEAQHNQVLRPGMVAIAPGDFHLEVVRDARGLVTRLSQGPAENFCRPAVDVLFRSAAAVTGAATLAVVLTGMGSDGCKGAGPIVTAGGSVIAQDQATSVVWGMPGAIAGAGLAEEILPLDEIAAAITRRLVPSGIAAMTGRNS